MLIVFKLVSECSLYLKILIQACTSTVPTWLRYEYHTVRRHPLLWVYLLFEHTTPVLFCISNMEI